MTTPAMTGKDRAMPNNSDQAAMLPCPWCGESLGQPVTVSEGSTFRWRKVDGCCTDGPEIRHNTMADDQAAAEVESHAKAVAAWNRRAALAMPASEAVAWRWMASNKEWNVTSSPAYAARLKDEGRDVKPLYSTPPPSPAAHAGGEAVAWQCRYRSQASRPWSEWEDSDKELFDSLQVKPQVTWEARELFTATSSAELLRLAEKWRRLASYEDEEGEPEQEAGSVARLRICAEQLTALLSGGAAREGK